MVHISTLALSNCSFACRFRAADGPVRVHDDPGSVPYGHRVSCRRSWTQLVKHFRFRHAQHVLDMLFENYCCSFLLVCRPTLTLVACCVRVFTRPTPNRILTLIPSGTMFWSSQVHELPSPDRDRVRWVHPVPALPVRAVLCQQLLEEAQQEERVVDHYSFRQELSQGAEGLV